jgi:hypothetical protein
LPTEHEVAFVGHEVVAETHDHEDDAEHGGSNQRENKGEDEKHVERFSDVGVRMLDDSGRHTRKNAQKKR